MSETLAAPAEPRLDDIDPAFVARFLAGMPPDLAARFDARMLFAVQQRIGPWNGVERRRGAHLRLRLPWGAWRLSLVRERSDHRAVLPVRSAIAGAAAGAVGAVAAILALV
ncbi:hypothetical protein J5Y09_10825 [Roseomonas sp. PWR1]|uniref:Uncharacterized protein n=1 Tax=Roseomonas nitratireducens TaxID=2820810 RepID=A0ABS4AST0_9PROT|nr:hypothetical protein [Neoroseomonas nitratireducens]MBP0464408.1 hypothetical protein [Neoroseomonas nitratireducens]